GTRHSRPEEVRQFPTAAHTSPPPERPDINGRRTGNRPASSTCVARLGGGSSRSESALTPPSNRHIPSHPAIFQGFPSTCCERRLRSSVLNVLEYPPACDRC